jgi:hypothetical protein
VTRAVRAARYAVTTLIVLAALAGPIGAGTAAAQSAPASVDIGVRGYGSAGLMIFSAADSFDAVLGTRSLATFGGGVEVLLGDHLFVGAGAWRASRDGERVFVGEDGEVFHLGIPLAVAVTPVEITGGWRFTRIWRRAVPYAGGGLTSVKYTEDVDTDDPGEDVSGRFTGFHVLGGVELRVNDWLGLAGEVAWSSVPDALGDAGASQAFDEDNLGGTAIRVKVVVGR